MIDFKPKPPQIGIYLAVTLLMVALTGMIMLWAMTVLAQNYPTSKTTEVDFVASTTIVEAYEVVHEEINSLDVQEVAKSGMMLELGDIRVYATGMDLCGVLVGRFFEVDIEDVSPCD